MVKRSSPLIPLAAKETTLGWELEACQLRDLEAGQCTFKGTVKATKHRYYSGWLYFWIWGKLTPWSAEGAELLQL
jgi:hypothetical protein